MRRGRALLGLGATLALAACDFAPRYARPQAPVPPGWPVGGAYPAPPPAPAAAGITWQALIGDARLRALVTRALADNRDLRAALAQVESARAQYRVQRSALFPTIAAQANATLVPERGSSGSGVATGTTQTGSGTTQTTATNQSFNSYQVGGGFSAWEIDLFGRLRDLTRAAREQYLASDEGARETRITIVAELANAWTTLAADLDLLRVAQDTSASAGRTLALTQELDRAGLVSKLDVRQAETVVAQADSDVENYRTQVEQDRNAVQLLVGSPVDNAYLPRGLAEIAQSFAVPPAGLSSDVLLARPDVLQAEHQLKAANANIGAARARFFPTISLTTIAGFASTTLANLFTGGAFGLALQPSASLPIFGGQNRGNLAYSRAQRDYYLAQYEGAIQAAFRDVANALARRGTIDRQVADQRRLVAANQATLTLAAAQYQAGIATYLNTLTAQRSLYAAQQTLVAGVLADVQNRVALYSALGADNPRAEAQPTTGASPRS